MDNKQIVHRYVEEVFRTGNLSVIDELIAPDYADHVAVHGGIASREDLKDFVRSFLTAFDDAELTLDDVIAEGDRVAWRWIHTGVHVADFLGVPATGKRVEWSGIIIWRIKDGRVVAWWANTDTYGLMQQLGAT